MQSPRHFRCQHVLLPLQTDVTDMSNTPAMLDLGDVTFVRSTDPAEGFTNPLYGGAVQVFG